MDRLRECPENVFFPLSDTHPLFEFFFFFFCNKTKLSFTPKSSTLVLYQCLHTQLSWVSPLYHSCLQAYNLKVLRLLLLVLYISLVFTLTLKGAVVKLHLLYEDRLLCSFLFPTLVLPSMFCLVFQKITSQSIPPGGRVREIVNGNGSHMHRSSSVRTCNTSPNLFLFPFYSREKLEYI